MTLTPKPKSKTQFIEPKTQNTKPKNTPHKTKLTPENYEKLRRLTGSGFSRVYKTNYYEQLISNS